MSAQEAELARLTQVVNDTGAELDSIHGELQAEVDSLQAQINEGKTGKELNLQPLSEAIDQLKPHADALKGVTPDNIPAAAASSTASSTAATPASQEAAPTKPDGTAVENTTDPAVAAEQASSGSASTQ